MTIQNEYHHANRSAQSGESGSALLAAVICLAVLFTITLSTAQFTVSTARDARRHTQAGEDDWSARGASATIESSVRVDIPTAYAKELALAHAVSNTAMLPAFDPPGTANSLPIYSPSSWTVGLSPSGSVTVSANPLVDSGTGRTSLLGDLPTWLVTHKALPLQYAQQLGYSSSQANVAFLEEAYRQPQTGSSSPEPLYVVRFAADGKAGYGRDRVTGLIALGPGSKPCAPPVIQSFTASPTSVQANQTVTLSWNVINATSVTVSWNEGGNRGNIVQVLPPNSSTTDTPQQDTQYNLSAQTPCGTVNQSVTVTVTSSGGGGGLPPGVLEAWCDTTSLFGITVNSRFVAIDTGSSGIAVGGSVTVTPDSGGAWACQPLISATIVSPVYTNGSLGLSIVGVGWTSFPGTDLVIVGPQYNAPTGSFSVGVVLGQLLPPGSKLGGGISWGVKLHLCSGDGCCFDWSFGASPSSCVES
jgi:hypothetical protein